MSISIVSMSDRDDHTLFCRKAWKADTVGPAQSPNRQREEILRGKVVEERACYL